MPFSRTRRVACALMFSALPALAASAADWPMWGGTSSRNMVAPAEKALPISVDAGKTKPNSEEIDPATTKNVKWIAKLGSQTYGNPTVAGGRIFVGTNNASPRNPALVGDRGVLLCLDEATGRFLWQLSVPKLAAGKNVDWEEVGICSSPTVDANRIYAVTNRCEVICLDAEGMANGNDGPFTDEARYTAGPTGTPAPSGPTDADIIWRYDMRRELGVFPHFQTSSSVLVVGDRLYVTTSNSVDWTDKHTPSPDAPALICLDKRTGKLLARESSGISARTLYSNWSSPAFGTVGGKPTVVFGGGDGFVYGFDPDPQANAAGAGVLRELWRIDGNPPEYRQRDGKPVKYRDSKGYSEIIATPVIEGNRVFVPVGQDPEHGDGAGCLNCIEVKSDASGKAAASYVWRYKTISRSMSTPSVAGGLVYCADATGVVHCLDVLLGQPAWTHDAEAHVWGSTLVADGKMYMGSESGEVTVLSAGKELKVLGKFDMGAPVFSTPVAVNGVLYVATGPNLYAIQEAKK